MDFGEIFFYIAAGLLLLFLIKKIASASVFSKTKEEKEYERMLKESMADEFIYDAETGARLTLEQAESGHWIENDNYNRIKSQEELDRHYFGKEREIEEMVNEMKKSGYEFTILSDSQLAFLENSKMLSKYDEWSYSHPFSFNYKKDFVFFPNVRYSGSRYELAFQESQILFWIKDDRLSGHFYLREKTAIENLSDHFKSDDLIKIKNYETFAFKKSQNQIYVTKTLSKFEKESGLEIEVIDNNLLVKTLKFVNDADFYSIEKIVKSLFLLCVFFLVSCSNKKLTPVGAPKSIQHIYKTFDIGDVNNDGKNERATVNYNFDFTNQEVNCYAKSCPITIQFGDRIPSIEIDYAQSIYVEKADDLNNDGANEILIFSLTSEGYWNNISVYSLQNNTWTAVAETKGYLAENADFKDRILQSSGKKYLLGDAWDVNYDSIQMRSLRIEIN